MSKRHHTPIQRAATSTKLPPDNEAPWQQLMVFNYLIHEAVKAMEQEREEHSYHTPLNQSWQDFVYHLRQRNPKLGICLDLWQQNGMLDGRLQ